ncbi:hypothetical protein FRC17_010250 [Serendipita sp. 399]|nr:hypothetical protein FRC17_010250 [Serendipita sp. 399]
MKHTVKAPRDQLERCLFVLRLSADLMKDKDLGKTKEVCKFVDEAYDFLKQAASGKPPGSGQNQPRTGGATAPEQKWDEMKQAIHTIAHLVPERDVEAQVQQVDLETQKTSSKLVSVSKIISSKAAQGSGTRDIDLLILGEEWKGTVFETLNIKKRTPPYALATAFAFHRGKSMVGSTVDFYHIGQFSSYARPAHWEDREETPKCLYVVPSRGYFTFCSIPSVMASFMQNQSVFRNIIQFGAHGTIYLKESSGMLWKPPGGNILDGDSVLCGLEKRAKQPKKLIAWDEVVAEIKDKLDETWKVEAVSKDEANPPAVQDTLIDTGDTNPVDGRRESGQCETEDHQTHQISSQAQNASRSESNINSYAQDIADFSATRDIFGKPATVKRSLVRRALDWVQRKW